MKKNKLTKILFLLAVSLGMAACSWGEANDYHEGDLQPSVSTVEIPEEYNTTEMEQYYPIPSVVVDKNALKMSSLEPPKDAIQQ